MLTDSVRSDPGGDVAMTGTQARRRPPHLRRLAQSAVARIAATAAPPRCRRRGLCADVRRLRRHPAQCEPPDRTRQRGDRDSPDGSICICNNIARSVRIAPGLAVFGHTHGRGEALPRCGFAKNSGSCHSPAMGRPISSQGASPSSDRHRHLRDEQSQTPSQRATGCVSLTAKYRSRRMTQSQSSQILCIPAPTPCGDVWRMVRTRHT
jgi:hypothetical protein